jgi:hypothetical protein
MSHNKIFKVYDELPVLISSYGTNQRYKLLKTKPKDIFITASYQILRILYIRHIKF